MSPPADDPDREILVCTASMDKRVLLWTLVRDHPLFVSGFRVQGLGCGPWFVTIPHLFRVQGSGFRVQGSGFRVQGLGCGPWFVTIPRLSPHTL